MDNTSWKERGTSGWSYTVMLEVDASEFFEDESIDWQYCVKHATFRHKDDDVCEFVLHIGSDENGDHYKIVVDQMTEFGCTPGFIEVYKAAAQEGAVRVLFYV